MSEDIDPTFGLDDATTEAADTTAAFDTDTDIPDVMGMAEFDPDFPGLDPDNSGTSWTNTEPGGSGEPGSGGQGSTGQGSAGQGPSGQGSAGGATGASSSTGSGGSDSDNWMKGAMGSSPGSGADAEAPTSSGAEATTSTEQFETDEPSPGASTDPDPGSSTAPGAAASTDLTVSIDGENIVIGPPTLDISGDGVADTVVVENEGNVEYYVDADQDGVADQIIVLDENDGTLVNHEVYDPSSGTWTNVTADSKNNA